MSRIEHLRLMADYNEWMNTKLYSAARRLPGEALTADRNAFFGSILGTLNHLAVGDTLWLKRFANHPAAYPALDPVRTLPDPTSLGQVIFADFEALSSHRKLLDRTIVAWSRSIKDRDLEEALAYTTMTTGVAARKNFFSLVMNFFNHQTHHRGQVTTLLSQAGIDVGVTDLLTLIPDDDTPLVKDHVE